MHKLHLKPNATEEDAKEYACDYMCRTKNIEEIKNELKELEIAIQDNLQDEEKYFYLNRIKENQELLNDDDYINGNYHQGIDTIILELIEYRAMFYAFTNVDIDEQPFNKYIFFQQWKIGAIYAIYCNLAKLTNRGEENKSLRNLWINLERFIKANNETEEIKYISKQFDNNSKRFSNEESKAMFFRNKVISHNERSCAVDFDALDNDILFLFRAWSIITIWSSLPILFPFRENEQVFLGLDKFYTDSQLTKLKTQRNLFLDKVKLWGRTNLITSEIDNRTPFASLSINIRPAEPSNQNHTS